MNKAKKNIIHHSSPFNKFKFHKAYDGTKWQRYFINTKYRTVDKSKEDDKRITNYWQLILKTYIISG